jgi:hypothetical protein
MLTDNLMTIPTDGVQEEFNEQVQSVYRRSKNKQEGDRELISQGDALLAQIDVLAASSEEFQVYIGLAFHRRLLFEKKALLEKLIVSGPCPTTVLASLRAHKMVKVAASAKTAWDGLWIKEPRAMWNAVILNSREQNKVARVAAEAEEAAAQNIDDENDGEMNDHD